jgi:anaerobic selenocysteine-containing dehydrogenase
MYTFDVRLSNTAAKSTEWIPVKPGTDLAVVLAMCNVIMENDLYDENFIKNHTNVTADELKQHLAGNTPEWAEQISSVPAKKIRSIALEYANAKQKVCTSFRGAFMHYNGVQTQRAIYLLKSISGTVATSGFSNARPRWDYPFPPPEPKEDSKSLDIFDGEEGKYAKPDWGVSHQTAHMIDIGPERPEIYLIYCHNPVYSNGECKDNVRIYKDESKIPFLIAVDVALSESAELADLVLPDATYLERWSCLGKTSPDGIPEYYIRQPMHAPLGEARNFVDVAIEMAKRMDFDLGFGSAEEFVKGACENTPGVKEAGGFEYMKEHGIWHDKEATGREYPCPVMTVKSEVLEENGFDAMPAWMPIPTHEKMAADDLVLTTFKVSVHTHSRTQNCKWLTELFHENPAWINPKTAATRGIKNSDLIRVKSDVGEIMTKAYVTEGIHPKAIAIAHHCGHWAWGQYASGKKDFVHQDEPDSRNKWWKDNGAHVNIVIPNIGDPIGGSMCWMDTVVKVSKA